MSYSTIDGLVHELLTAIPHEQLTLLPSVGQKMSNNSCLRAGDIDRSLTAVDTVIDIWSENFLFCCFFMWVYISLCLPLQIPTLRNWGRPVLTRKMNTTMLKVKEAAWSFVFNCTVITLMANTNCTADDLLISISTQGHSLLDTHACSHRLVH